MNKMLIDMPEFKIHKVVFLLQKIADRLLQDKLNLTLSQLMILIAVRCYPKCSQKDVAEFRNLTPAAVSRQVEILRKKKMVLREENIKNRRQHILRLTSLGKKQLDCGLKLIDQKFKDLFKTLTLGERKVLNRGLDKLLEAICGGTELSACNDSNDTNE